jgi:hypothetical protein
VNNADSTAMGLSVGIRPAGGRKQSTRSFKDDDEEMDGKRLVINDSRSHPEV